MRKYKESIRKKDNLVQYGDRYVYVKCVECQIGRNKDRPAYAYICYDVDGANDTSHKAIKRAAKKKYDADFMHTLFESSGYFILISSLPFKPDEILIVYYVRQSVEQYFDVSKGLARLTPLRGHDEIRVNGHLLLSQVAATTSIYIQKAMSQYFENSEEMFMGLRNQKCVVYSSRIITNEGQSNATSYYKKFRIKYPLYFDKSGDKLTPHYTLPVIATDE